MMSDNDIRKDFQSKLSGFEIPVSQDGWEGVERSLNGVIAARKAFRRRWYAGSVAAVLVLLVGSVLFFHKSMDPIGKMIPEMVSTSPLDHNEEQPDQVVNNASERVFKTSRPPIAKRHLVSGTPPKTGPRATTIVSSSSSTGLFSAWMQRQKRERAILKKNNEIVPIRILAESSESDLRSEGEKEHVEETFIVRGRDQTHFQEDMIGERGKKPLLLAINGKGGLSDYRQTVNSPMTLRSAPAIPEGIYGEINKMPFQVSNAAGNVSEMEHDQPVSIGITVSKYILDDLSIETGLVYSYLHSKIRNSNNNFQVEEVQKLHYLGIPLNVNYTVFTLGRLNVYASVGGMIEKDIYGEFRKIKEGQGSTNFNSALEEGAEEKEITKISQQNPQISVNAGIGLSYPLYDRLRLYGKMGGAYYFNAKNPYKTIYSDRKIVMDLNVGLRYEF